MPKLGASNIKDKLEAEDDTFNLVEIIVELNKDGFSYKPLEQPAKAPREYMRSNRMSLQGRYVKNNSSYLVKRIIGYLSWIISGKITLV